MLHTYLQIEQPGKSFSLVSEITQKKTSAISAVSARVDPCEVRNGDSNIYPLCASACVQVRGEGGVFFTLSNNESFTNIRIPNLCTVVKYYFLLITFYIFPR